MDKYDLLDKIIEEHISNLRELCHSASDMSFQEGNYVWFEYFADNHLFFSTMLNTKSAAYFRSRFLDLVVQDYRVEVDVTEGKNQRLNGDHVRAESINNKYPLRITAYVVIVIKAAVMRLLRVYVLV